MIARRTLKAARYIWTTRLWSLLQVGSRRLIKCLTGKKGASKEDKLVE
jgi:hypothetical protein